MYCGYSTACGRAACYRQVRPPPGSGKRIASTVSCASQCKKAAIMRLAEAYFDNPPPENDPYRGAIALHASLQGVATVDPDSRASRPPKEVSAAAYDNKPASHLKGVQSQQCSCQSNPGWWGCFPLALLACKDPERAACCRRRLGWQPSLQLFPPTYQLNARSQRHQPSLECAQVTPPWQRRS